jgi:adenine-specific DNA-methyltransferase
MRICSTTRIDGRGIREKNLAVSIVVKKKSVTTTTDPINDFLLWYAKDKKSLKLRRLFEPQKVNDANSRFSNVLFQDGSVKDIDECQQEDLEQENVRFFNDEYPLVSQDEQEGRSGPFLLNGQPLFPGRNRHWTYDPEIGMRRLAERGWREISRPRSTKS